MLRIDLGPFQELHIGRCIIKNSQERSLFAVEGNMPVLRGNEYLPETGARAPLQKLYYCIQQMYLEEAQDKYQCRYLQLKADCLRNHPNLSAEIETADRFIKNGNFYRALKSIRTLASAFDSDSFGRDQVGRFADAPGRKSIRFELGPFEELHIVRCTIVNSHEKSLLAIEGKIPILIGKKFLPEIAAHTPLEKLYCCIQQMYLEEAPSKYQGRYLQYAAETLRNDPSLSADLNAADHLITAGDFYTALKSIKKLIPTAAFASKGVGTIKVGRPANYIARVNGWKQRQ